MKNITDIVHAQPKRRRWWPIWCLAGLMSLLILTFYPSDGVTSVAQDVRIAEVTRGDLLVQIYGYGRVQSKHQRLLTAEAQGVVEQVLLKPGARVTSDSVILVLSAPDLLDRLAETELEYARVKAEFGNQQLQHKDTLLAQDAEIAQLESDFELAKLTVVAETELVKQGIVSELDFQQSQLAVRQLKARLDIANQRRMTLVEMASRRERIQADLITRYADRLDSLRRRVDRLHVRADLDGVLQALTVEIGQSVSQGAQLATVGSTNQLTAELRVAQDQADQIAPGNPARILTQGHTIPAQVIRLDPVVTDGRVIVELDLSGELPANARPDLTVEGRIEVDFLQDRLLLEAPTDILAFSSKRLFKLLDDPQIAEATRLKFGNLSGGQIEVLGGATEGDRVIISDTSQWQKADRVELTN